MLKKILLSSGVSLVVFFGLFSLTQAQTPLAATFTSPSSDTTWQPGQTYTVSWSSPNISTSPNRAYLVNKDFPSLQYTIFSDFSQPNPDPKSFTYTVPPLFNSPGVIMPGKYFLRLRYGLPGTLYESQTPVITVAPTASARLINISNPSSSTQWTAGTSANVTWTSPNVSSSFTLNWKLYSLTTGLSVAQGSNVPNTGSMTIPVPANAWGGGQFQLELYRSYGSYTITGFTPPFTIVAPSNITLSAPYDGSTGTTFWNNTASPATIGCIGVNPTRNVEAYVIRKTATANTYLAGSSGVAANGTCYGVVPQISTLQNIPTGDYTLEVREISAPGVFTGAKVVSPVTIKMVNPSIYNATVTAPLGGDQWPPSGQSQYNSSQFMGGDFVNVTWQTTPDILANTQMNVRLMKFNTWSSAGTQILQVTSPNDSNQSIQILPSDITAGKYYFEVAPVNLVSGVLVQVAKSGVFDVVPYTAPTYNINFTSPLAGANWPAGSNQVVAWSNNLPTTEKLNLERLNASTGQVVATVRDIPNTNPSAGNYVVNPVPNAPGAYKYRLSSAFGRPNSSGESGVFNIVGSGAPSISITSPTSSPSTLPLYISQNYLVNWNNNNIPNTSRFTVTLHQSFNSVPQPAIFHDFTPTPISFNDHFTITIPQSLAQAGGYPSGDYDIQVCALPVSGIVPITCDYLGKIKIASLKISVSFPQSGEIWRTGVSPLPINSVRWNAPSIVPATQSISAQLFTEQGIPQQAPFSLGVNDGHYASLVPTVPTGNYYYELDTANIGALDIAPGRSGMFTITNNYGNYHSTGTDRLTGWAWSSGMGWIYFGPANSTSFFDEYGVKVDENNNNNLNGFAWGPNIGWIEFDPSGPYPDSNTPPYSSRLTGVTPNQKIEGWARACSVFVTGCMGNMRHVALRGEWDGWIKMNGTWSNGVAVKVDATSGARNLVGYAWGSNNLGWVSFCDEAGGTHCTNLPPVTQPLPTFELRTVISPQSTGTGSISVSPAGLPCATPSPSCYRYTAGTLVTVTANPSSGSKFISPWTGVACSNATVGSCNTASFTFPKSGSLDLAIARFDVQKYQFSTIKIGTGDGNIAVSPVGSPCAPQVAGCYMYDLGTVITVTGNPVSGSKFVSPWTGSACGTATTGACDTQTFIFTKNNGIQTSIGKFDLDDGGCSSPPCGGGTNYTVTVNLQELDGVTNGQVTNGTGISCLTNGASGCTKSYPAGTSVVLSVPSVSTLSPTVFTGWSGGGCSGPGILCNLGTLNSDKTVTATFKRFILNLDVAGENPGEYVTGLGTNCTASCSKTYTATTSVTLTANPAGLNRSVTWSGAGSACSGNTCTVNVDGVKDVIATFGQTTASGINFRVSATTQITSTDPQFAALRIFNDDTSNAKFCISSIVSRDQDPDYFGKSMQTIINDSGCGQVSHPVCDFKTSDGNGLQICTPSNDIAGPSGTVNAGSSSQVNIHIYQSTCLADIELASPYDLKVYVCNETATHPNNVKKSNLLVNFPGICEGNPDDCK